MAKTFNIGKYAADLQNRAVHTVSTERDNEMITAEILRLKQDIAHNIIGIGQRLIEMKARLSHGEWLPWLSEQVYFSEKTAENYMRVARDFPNPQLVADLGVRKALALLALPSSEREDFVEEHSVIDMTARELEQAIRERDEARKAAEAAQAEAESAEVSRAKMETDLAALRQLQASAQTAEAQARDALAKAQAELQALREKPVEVAVETVVDQKAIEKARADAIAEMQAKVEKAEAVRKAAEKQRTDAEKALAEVKEQAGVNAEILSRAEKAEAELAQVRRKLEETTQEQSPIHSDADLAAFNILFSQAQEQANKMRELLCKTRERDPETAGQLENALLALAELVRGCAE